MVDGSGHDLFPPDFELRQFEVIASHLKETYPAASMSRTREVIEIAIDGMNGVVVILTPDEVEVRLPTTEWVQLHLPMKSTRHWRRIPIEDVQSDATLALVASGLEAREREHFTCRLCGERTPPEHAFGDVCTGCAERHLGVIH